MLSNLRKCEKALSLKNIILGKYIISSRIYISFQQLCLRRCNACLRRRTWYTLSKAIIERHTSQLLHFTVNLSNNLVNYKYLIAPNKHHCLACYVENTRCSLPSFATTTATCGLRQVSFVTRPSPVFANDDWRELTVDEDDDGDECRRHNNAITIQRNHVPRNRVEIRACPILRLAIGEDNKIDFFVATRIAASTRKMRCHSICVSFLTSKAMNVGTNSSVIVMPCDVWPTTSGA